MRILTPVLQWSSKMCLVGAIGASGGCAGPAYVMLEQDYWAAEARRDGRAVVSAREESTGRLVGLRFGSVHATGKVPPDKVQVRGWGRRHPMWVAGAIVTGVGLVLGGAGAAMAVDGFSRGYCENGCAVTHNDAAAELWIGLVTSILGDICVAGVGPSLWITGAVLGRPHVRP